ncbi:transcriptional regulator [Saccharibacillus alkalitolerans]|uniref:Transcriptional regulator n=1 Tax=Saccharibacillus alkalitolerans TaxID=2705290 RepID=A0ABX0FAD1_9BACL|nr:transcriptional regulator [Saccharibacillus alkalitolerans]NGZ77903.1 transcriptional regulator [Saccharibacillus alkalitolerans]
MRTNFEETYAQWLAAQIEAEDGVRRLELLKRGLGHGTIEFLRRVWYPAVGNLDDLHAEWEVRDYHGGYRYIDLAYRPGGAKGAIEIQGYGSHARDLDTRRFKDLCWRHGLLGLDGWTLLPVAYLSICEERERCQQLVLAFVGRFLSFDLMADGLGWLEEETLRYARRRLVPFGAGELASHLRVTDRHARAILQKLAARKLITAVNDKQRYRTYRLAAASQVFGGTDGGQGSKKD